jgi:hypothetical protein
MSEEDLELLITLDDPEGAPVEDTFHHIATENVVYRRGKPLDQRIEAVANKDSDEFGFSRVVRV